LRPSPDVWSLARVIRTRHHDTLAIIVSVSLLGFACHSGDDGLHKVDATTTSDQDGSERIGLDAAPMADAQPSATSMDAQEVLDAAAALDAEAALDAASGLDAASAPDAATAHDAATVLDAAFHDASLALDAAQMHADAAASHPDASSSAPDASTYTGCPSGPPLTGGGTTGPINIVDEQGHGLPGCYRCQIDVADFDGDGRVDVVMAGPFDSAFTPDMSNYTYQNRIRLFRNVSCPGQQIRFQEVMTIPDAVGGGGALVVVGDYNGDGRPDFAVQFREGDHPLSDASAWMNMGNWTFVREDVGMFNTNSTSLGMAKADFNRDGKDDLVFNSDAYGAAPGLWYSWNGTAFVAHQTNYPHEVTYGGSITAGDLDGDGWPDIAVNGNASMAFGNRNCSSTLMVGEIHYNTGAPGAISMDANDLGNYAMLVEAGIDPVPTCSGMDNGALVIADVDHDGHNDIVLAGSADAFRGPPPGPPQTNGSQYDFAVMFNKDGTGHHFVTWENAGIQYPNGTTNGGCGNVDAKNIAIGDLNGDGFPEIFILGHKRDYGGDVGSYIFDSKLFLNNGGNSFTELNVGLQHLGEGGEAMADFNNDGKMDFVYAGASIPWHSNGNNNVDHNNASTLYCHVYRNVRP
jgi:hypothetical protein